MHGNKSRLRTRIDRLRWSRYCENNDLAIIADDVLCEMTAVMVKVRRRRLLVTFGYFRDLDFYLVTFV